MSENMVERVARAIAQLIGPQEFDRLPKDKQALKAAMRAGAEPVFDSQDDILEIARAAIEATIAFLVEQGTASRQTIRDLEAALKP